MVRKNGKNNWDAAKGKGGDNAAKGKGGGKGKGKGKNGKGDKGAGKKGAAPFISDYTHTAVSNADDIDDLEQLFWTLDDRWHELTGQSFHLYLDQRGQDWDVDPSERN